MRLPLIITGFLTGFLFFSSCSDVLEKDLKDDQVVLKAPVNGLRVPTQSHTFWWEEFDEVIDGYRLEIVSPRFDSIVNLILRENITEGTTFETTLFSGTYQWSVVAYNSTSETEPVIYDLTITGDSAMDLSSQTLNLVSPNNNDAFTTTDVTFLWQLLENANDYKIQIASPDFTNSTYIIENETLQTDSYNTTLSEGEYSWRVRAENDESVTPFSERSFSIDLTAPDAPVLVSPNQGDTVTVPVTLSWNVDAESIMDTLYVYTDSLMSDPILQVPITNTTYSFDENAEELYYWRLRSVDQAGNTSSFSSLRKFFIEQ